MSSPAPGHSNPGPKPVTLQDVTAAQATCPEGDRPSTFFSLLLLFLSHHLNWSIQVNYSPVGGFSLHIDHTVWSKCPCAIQWVLIIYFIKSSVHILVWSSPEGTDFSMPHIFFILVVRSFFSKSVKLCLWARSSIVSIFTLHVEVIS